jgi:hypothetical protein
MIPGATRPLPRAVRHTSLKRTPPSADPSRVLPSSATLHPLRLGARADHIDGRSVTTVFYADTQGRRIGYAIVSGPAWATHGGTLKWRAGVPYRLLTHDGATVVAWPRGGHLCVVSGRGVDAQTLLRLAGWSGGRPAAA